MKSPEETIRFLENMIDHYQKKWTDAGYDGDQHTQLICDAKQTAWTDVISFIKGELDK